jgi:oligopeptidase B
VTTETDASRPGALPTPPVARRLRSVRELHGETVADDYAWMREPEQPALHAYLAAERAYYDAHSQRLDGLAGRLTAEATSRIPAEAEYSVRWHLHGFTYRLRTPQDSDNAQLLRSRDDEDSSEQILLDDNLVAAQTGYAEVAVREPSPSGVFLAWSADTTGAEIYELRIRDLRTGQDLPEVIAPSYPGVAWCVASRYLFYLVPDELHRPFQVRRHLVGTPASADALVFEEPDQRFELTLHRSRSGEVAVITAASRDTTEVRVIRLRRPLDDAVLVEPRRRGIEYRIDHERSAADGAGSLHLVTNSGAAEFTLMRVPLAVPARAGWNPVTCPATAPARDDTRLLRCDVLADHLVLTIRRHGEPLLVITDHDGASVREIPPSLCAGSIRVEHAEDYDRGSIIIAEESLIEPPAWYQLDLRTASRQLCKRLEVPGYDPARYRTERLTAPADDGTPIPVTLARREDVPLDGRAPCLLYGYGAYEESLDPEFDRSLPSLLDRGVIYAVAHVRGGGECGREWWQQGRLRAKPTTFTDYLAVADWLAGSPKPALVDGSRIVSRGLSAGGLLQGAVYSMRPDRWRAVVAEVPFVDVVNTMLDASIPLTVGEWDEWGDPRKRDDYAWLRSYSPYDNPPSGRRPALLVTGAVHDARVGIHEPAKWVAKLRATDTEGSHLLFRPELGVGAHGGPSGRGARFRYEAEMQTFILDAMGITD